MGGAAAVVKRCEVALGGVTVPGDGEVVRDYLYIKDTVKALVAAATYQAGSHGPRLFNIGSGAGYSLNQIVDTIKQTAQHDPNNHYYTSTTSCYLFADLVFLLFVLQHVVRRLWHVIYQIALQTLVYSRPCMHQLR